MAKRNSKFQKDNTKKGAKRMPQKRTGRTSTQKFDAKSTEDRGAEYSAYSTPNDPAWYAQNAQLMSDVASFSYNFPVGSKMPFDSNNSEFINYGSVPGIMTIHLAPRFGLIDEANDAMNVAMRNLYSFVRHANSGSTNYEAPDLMLYLALMDSCFSFIEVLKRVYGTLMTYSFTNRYFPLAAVRAQGFNFVDLQENIADFRAYINTLAVKIGSMCIPASMSYMARHMWVYSGMYYDTPSDEKAQVYMYVPEAFYAFNHDVDGAGCATLVDFDRNSYRSKFVYPFTNDNVDDRGWTFTDIVDFGNRLIDPILKEEDFNVMSGDILKAFGANNVYMVSTIPENYTVLPIYHQEVLNQIHNAALVGRAITPTYTENFLNGILPVATPENSLHQSSDKTYLITYPQAYIIAPISYSSPNQWTESEYKPALTKLGEPFAGKRLMDFESGPVSPAMAMVASRLMAFGEYNTVKVGFESDRVAQRYHGCEDDSECDALIQYRLLTTGSETASYAKIWYWAKVGYNKENEWALVHTDDIYSSMIVPVFGAGVTQNDFDTRDETATDVYSFLYSSQRRGLISSFNMHPAIKEHYLYESDAPGEGTIFLVTPETWPQFDINYYTVLDSMDVEQMHDTALLSEFNITQYGRKA